MNNNMTYSQMAQLELMNAAANVNSQEDLDALKLTISLFFAEKAQREIDQMWAHPEQNRALYRAQRKHHPHQSPLLVGTDDDVVEGLGEGDGEREAPEVESPPLVAADARVHFG